LFYIDLFQGCDRSLLPTLWLAAGFELGASIVVYVPPNPIELRQYLLVKRRFEERLNRSISIRLIYDGNDILSLYENDADAYTHLCKQWFQCPKSFIDDFHLRELKRHLHMITRDAQRSFVFPFETMDIHRNELSIYKNLVLADVPTIDKAKHNLLLRKHKFTELPHLLVSADRCHRASHLNCHIDFPL
jgi:hypothetical protein